MAKTTALATLLNTAPEQAYELKIHQVVTICADGVLRDGSPCSEQFRQFLQAAPSTRLGAYASECLNESSSISGLILQDVINELGRRLDYSVEDGLYRGRTNSIGYDGIWRSDSGAIVVEVKTTDAYRINLDTIASYRDRLRAENRIPAEASTLIVVGRQDTGDLEAQVRGSRHAWSVRLISVDALTQLVAIKERTESPTTRKIHDLLTPFEYTKLDRIIDVVFDVAEDASVVTAEDAANNAEEDTTTEVDRVPESPDFNAIQTTRNRIVAALSRKFKPLVRQSNALYWTADKRLRFAMAVSRRYESRSAPYWYAYIPRHVSFLKDADDGYYVLGCVDRPVAYAIPFRVMQSLTKRLRTTEKRNKYIYWHVDLRSDPGVTPTLRLIEPREDFDLSPFEIDAG